MKREIYQSILDKRAKNQKMLAVLVDPDKADREHLELLLSPQNTQYIDLLLVGGSLLVSGDIEETLIAIKELCDLPTIIFPGDADQICSEADAILLLSLISGRNAELLIGKHVTSAMKLKKSKLEIISTGYVLIDGGVETTASYISGSKPIPNNKPGIAASTALAGAQLGHHLIYLDAGSGAQQPVPSRVITATRNQIEIPLIVGGGIRSIKGIRTAWMAGADIVVIGNVLEEEPTLLSQLFEAELPKIV